LTWAAIAPRVTRGVRSLMTKGISVQLLDATCTAMVGVNGARTAYGAAGQEETVSPAVTYCLKVSGQPKTPYTLILTQDIP
jgi:hypothetical protein